MPYFNYDYIEAEKELEGTLFIYLSQSNSSLEIDIKYDSKESIFKPLRISGNLIPGWNEVIVDWDNGVV